MAEKKLSEELRHCLEGNGCADCTCYEQKSVLTCRSLLQKAYEVVKRYEGMYEIMRPLAERLNEFTVLEEQNRLLKLPCAVGDEFYCIWRNKGQNPIQKMQVKKIEIHERKGIVIQMEFVGNRGCLFRFYEDDFGKTVFLTRQEAEAKLAEMEGKK